MAKILLLFTVLLNATFALAERTDLVINKNWSFQFESDNSPVALVDLPHTWNRDDGQDPHYKRGVGIYRRRLYISRSRQKGRVYLRFEAANQSTTVIVNGVEIGRHDGGYTAFAFDMTAQSHFGGVNEIIVRVDNSESKDVAPIRADYTFFGGIYRSVHLVFTPENHISVTHFGGPGVEVRPTMVDQNSADVTIAVQLECQPSLKTDIEIAAIISSRLSVRRRLVACPEKNEILLPIKIIAPHLWNGRRDPFLYRVKIVVRDLAAKTTDIISQNFGLRWFQVDKSQGVNLNGQPYPLYGVSFHQDWPGFGWALNAQQERTDVDFLNELRVTSVRLAHYPHSEHIMDLLDRSGIIAWSEIPLISEISPSAAFRLSTEQQLLEMIHQQYNHPSVAFWGIFNEVHSDPSGLISDLNSLAHAADPSRQTVAASDLPVENPLHHITDLMAFNRYFGWYRGNFSDFGDDMDLAHQILSVPTGVSEYGAGASINQHQVPAQKPVASSGFHPEEWQTLFHQAHWQMIQERPFIWCSYVWNLFDFASSTRHEGAESGLNDKGLVTYDRKTRKDAFYFYRSEWNKNFLSGGATQVSGKTER